MMKQIRNYAFAALFALIAGGSSLAVMTPQTSLAAADCDGRLLTFPTWYRNLTTPAPDCNIKSPSDVGGLSTFIYTIVLNITEILLQLIGYAAVVFIIIGGFKYMTSLGSPGGMVAARKTILNAVIGLVISFFAVAIVNVVSGTLI